MFSRSPFWKFNVQEQSKPPSQFKQEQRLVLYELKEISQVTKLYTYDFHIRVTHYAFSFLGEATSLSSAEGFASGST